jgi:serine/threonine protein kinase
MFQVGVMLLMLLLGEYPPWKTPCALDKNFVAFFESGVASFMASRTLASPLSPSILDLLERLLVVDPRQRITHAEALAHPAVLCVTGHDMGPEDGPTGEVELS